MDTIPSFKIDHTKLKPGLYLSQQIEVGEYNINTFDIRVRAPYRDKPLSPAVSHTIEHLAASWLRSHYPNETVYFGPMGCLTGFYLILRVPECYDAMNYYAPAVIVKSCFEAIAKHEGPVPGSTEKECGNYKLMDLKGAKRVASDYIEHIGHKETKEDYDYE